MWSLPRRDLSCGGGWCCSSSLPGALPPPLLSWSLLRPPSSRFLPPLSSLFLLSSLRRFRSGTSGDESSSCEEWCTARRLLSSSDRALRLMRPAGAGENVARFCPSTTAARRHTCLMRGPWLLLIESLLEVRVSCESSGLERTGFGISEWLSVRVLSSDNFRFRGGRRGRPSPRGGRRWRSMRCFRGAGMSNKFQHTCTRHPLHLDGCARLQFPSLGQTNFLGFLRKAA